MGSTSIERIFHSVSYGAGGELNGYVGPVVDWIRNWDVGSRSV
jgi:hypothetical protein